MSNPFEGLRPALEVMAREGEILPATGQAIEDLMRPDQEEGYDRVRLGVSSDTILDLVIEAPNRELYIHTELLLVWLTPTYANSACISNSMGLRYPNVECRRVGL